MRSGGGIDRPTGKLTGKPLTWDIIMLRLLCCQGTGKQAEEAMSRAPDRFFL